MTKDAALKLALEALEQSQTKAPFGTDRVVYWQGVEIHEAAIAAVKEALAQPAQETKIGCVQHDCDECKARLAQRPWAGLTDEEIKECFKITPELYLTRHIYTRIEAKLKEKNT